MYSAVQVNVVVVASSDENNKPESLVTKRVLQDVHVPEVMFGFFSMFFFFYKCYGP